MLRFKLCIIFSSFVCRVSGQSCPYGTCLGQAQSGCSCASYADAYYCPISNCNSCRNCACTQNTYENNIPNSRFSCGGNCVQFCWYCVPGYTSSGGSVSACIGCPVGQYASASGEFETSILQISERSISKISVWFSVNWLNLCKLWRG